MKSHKTQGGARTDARENSGSLLSWVRALPDCGVVSFHFLEETQHPEAEQVLKPRVLHLEVGVENKIKKKQEPEIS